MCQLFYFNLSDFCLKDLRHGFNPKVRAYLETQLNRYKRAVGTEVAGRMVYSLEW